LSADVLEELRLALVGVPGDLSVSSCGCTWKRVPPGTFVHHGVRVSGDVLVRHCDFHAWLSAQPVELQRQVGRQSRARSLGEENRA
jgi:hypothetical protein